MDTSNLGLEHERDGDEKGLRRLVVGTLELCREKLWRCFAAHAHKMLMARQDFTNDINLQIFD